MESAPNCADVMTRALANPWIPPHHAGIVQSGLTDARGCEVWMDGAVINIEAEEQPTNVADVKQVRQNPLSRDAGNG
jgi:hypothetical protein